MHCSCMNLPPPILSSALYHLKDSCLQELHHEPPVAILLVICITIAYNTAPATGPLFSDVLKLQPPEHHL